MNSVPADGDRKPEPHGRRKRVLFVLSQRDYASNGGIKSLLELLKRLRNVQRHVWTSHDNDFTGTLNDVVESVEVHPLIAAGKTVPERLLSALRSNYETFRAIRREGIAIVHVNDRLAFWRTAFGAKLAGAAVVDNLRDTQPRLTRLRSLKWAAEFMVADLVIVLSDDMKRRWDQVLPISTEGWLSIYSAVDPERFSPMSQSERLGLRQRLGIGAEETALIYVGAFRDKKRQLQLIEQCLPQLLRKVPEAKVHFLGDFVPERDEYARACAGAVERLGLGESVRFHGHQNKVADWYRAADLTLLASAQEGLARSMIESLACGTPVVSFDVASAAEVLERHGVGWVVAQDDYQALASAVSDWARQTPMARSRYRKNAARVAAELFAPEQSAARYEAAYASQ